MARRFLIGPWVLNADSNTISTNGQVSRLEPRVADVCAYLAERPGEVIRKEELLQAVWPDTFVTDDVLTKAISELRKILKDDPRHPRFIETIAKRGYRLIAADSSNGWTGSGSRIREQPDPSFRPLRSHHGPPSDVAELEKKSRLSARLVIFGASVALVLGALGVSWWVVLSRRHHSTPKDTILITDFANRTDDPIFDGTLRQGLTTFIAQSPFFNVLSDQRVQDTLNLMERPSGEALTISVAREVCQRTGSTVVLTGSIASLGTQYVINLSATNCQGGQTLAREQAQAPQKEAVLSALGNAAVSLREKLGESRSSIQRFDMPLDRATTSSLEALKAFTLAGRTGGASDYSPLLRHALELDPRFALAYVKLADAADGAGEAEAAANYAKKAYDLRQYATERDRLEIAAEYESLVTGDLERELSVYTSWQELYPNDGGAWIDSASTRLMAGDYPRALHDAERAITLAPDVNTSYLNCGFALLGLNRWKELKSLAKQAQLHGMELPDMHLLLYNAAFIDGNQTEMAEQLDPLLSAPGNGTFDALLTKSTTEAFFGRLSESLLDSERSLKYVLDSPEIAAQVEGAAALHQAELGLKNEARRTVAKALSASGGRRVKLLAALVLARAGDTSRAQILADELSTALPKNTLLQKYWLPVIRASIELSHQNPSKAISLLQPTSYELSNTPILAGNLYPAYVRGQAYLGTHQGKEAAAEFQKFLDYAGIAANSPLAALARLGLARAYLMQRERERSTNAYRDFLNLWKDADPDIPILKQAKAEYAKHQ